MKQEKGEAKMTNDRELRWSVNELCAELHNDLGSRNPKLGRWVNGRLVGVLASPDDDSAHHLAVGVSALPPGAAAPVHDHEAEEVALIIAGSGRIVIGEFTSNVTTGDVVIAPSGASHQTIANVDSELLVLWIYAPPGSEQRWLQNGSIEG